MISYVTDGFAPMLAAPTRDRDFESGRMMNEGRRGWQTQVTTEKKRLERGRSSDSGGYEAFLHPVERRRGAGWFPKLSMGLIRVVLGSSSDAPG